MIGISSDEEDDRVLYFAPKPSTVNSSSLGEPNVLVNGSSPTASPLPFTPTSLDQAGNESSTVDDEVFEEECCFEQNMKPVSFIAARQPKENVTVPDEMKDRLLADIVAPWDPSSIFDGLGWSPSDGNLQDLSLIRLSSFLANLNMHLLIMNKEIVHIENTVRKAHADGKAEKLGFRDGRNIGHVESLMESLSDRCHSLSTASSRLSSALSSSPPPSPPPSPHPSSFSLSTLLIPSVVLLSFIAYKVFLNRK